VLGKGLADRSSLNSLSSLLSPPFTGCSEAARAVREKCRRAKRPPSHLACDNAQLVLWRRCLEAGIAVLFVVIVVFQAAEQAEQYREYPQRKPPTRVRTIFGQSESKPLHTASGPRPEQNAFHQNRPIQPSASPDIHDGTVLYSTT
jgi:hypothetical protein